MPWVQEEYVLTKIICHNSLLLDFVKVKEIGIVTTATEVSDLHSWSVC